jgi:GTP-binding protein
MPTTTNPPQPDNLQRLPIVAIVGRPNVGKSALFNRLLGRRLAIVHEESGVTRDRIVAEAEWQNRRFELVDTGGLTDTARSASRDAIVAETRQQAETAISDATLVLLVVDAQTGVLPLDEEVARLLHRKGARVIVAANKCDLPDRDDDVAVFNRLGFPVFPVSASHNRGVDDLMAKVTALLPTVDRTAGSAPLRIAVVGRPNVGKSSFINRLIRTPRMIVSNVPGTTRDSVDVPFMIGHGPAARRYVLTDTAGLRQIRKVDSSVERFSVFRAEKAIQNADVAVLILDAAQGPTSQDKAVADAVLREQKGCVIVVNKWDLMTEATEREYREALARALPFLTWVPVVFVSAVSGYNIRNALEAIDQVAAQIQCALPTGLLNRVIVDAWDRVQPPRLSGKRFNVYYATQVGTKPLRIALFVNDPQRLTNAYRDYLIHALRRRFGLEGAPVVLHCKVRTRPERPGHPAHGATDPSIT